jgi:hypothetical protein
MFKGESDLDVFQQSNSLKMLVDTFSDVKDFEAYFSFMEYATRKADQARDNAQKIDKKNYEIITGIIGNTSQPASFPLDLASGQNVLYRVKCSISPCNNGKYSSDNIALEIRSENIRLTDSYESCIKRIEEQQYSPNVNYLEELEKIEELETNNIPKE